MPVVNSHRFPDASLGEVVNTTRWMLGRFSLSEARWVGEFPDRLANEAQGRHVWSQRTDQQLTFVATLWARDYADRLTACVVGGTQDAGETIRHLAEPPLAILYGEHSLLFWRPEASDPDTLLDCACGVIGRLEEVGWMGDRCGPCHDRHLCGEPVPRFLQREYLRLDAPDLGAGTTFEMLNEIWSPGFPLTLAPSGELLVARRNGPFDHSGIIAEIALWDAHAARLTRTWATAAPAYNARFLDEDHVALFLGDAEADHLVILRLSDGQVRQRLPLAGTSDTIVVAGGQGMLYQGMDAWLSCLKLDQPDLLPRPLHNRHPFLLALGCSRSGNLLAIVESDSTLSLADSATGATITRTTDRVAFRPVDLVFLPDDRTLLLAEEDGRIAFFRVPDLGYLGSVRANTGNVLTVQFHGDWLVVLHSEPDALSRWPWQPLFNYVRPNHPRSP